MTIGMQLNLQIVTQEKELVNEMVDSVTATTTTGEVTILPEHIPLMTKLADTELIYKIKGQLYSLAVTSGFLNVEPENKVVILADSAIRSEEISEAKAEEAKKRAEATMQNEKLSKTELLIAEGDLRKALLQLKVVRKRKTHL
ncbi:ATP synthase F1 subunit epsilon [Candidatus Cerribacteria bacterium 'Amazon FNV 2010 28 9']|uniref:ATP synthase epsilon chain n=1 Tax=Candidatus Cerribacteria bacterium 'Amazon FNV 2010 28 9' TaxID=2081795 RepID=A0A317JMR4_9BACT|nr:MAG: ATP synthase F1 subunit epsilon [Candidatus Cerribacteria bacterium 'Amazon FNV 2010 28 9']